MAITKKLIHFKQFSNFNTQKLSANRENTSYTIGVGGTVTTGEPYILYQSIVFIQDVLKIWTHGSLYDCGSVDLSDYLTADEIAEVYATIEALNGKQDTITDLETIRSGAAKGATAVQPSSLPSNTVPLPIESGGTGANNKEDACTNLGAAKQYYMQKGLNKEGWYRIGLLTAVMSTSSARIVVGGTNADVAPIIMDFQHNFRGDMLSQMPTVMTPLYVTKVRACKLNSDDMYIDVYFTNIASSVTTVSVFPLEGTFEPMNFTDVTNSTVTVATSIDVVKDGFLTGRLTSEDVSDVAISGSYNDLTDKPIIKFEDMAASTWVSDSTYTDYPYRCDVTCSGVTADNYAEVVFALAQATSGNYAPLCETKTDAVSVWSSSNTSITIPTILITK